MMHLKSNTAIIAYGAVGPTLIENDFTQAPPEYLYDRESLDKKFFEAFGIAGRRAGAYIKLVSLGAVACLKTLPTELFSEYATGLYLGTGLGNVIDNVKFTLSILNPKNSFPSPVTFVNSVNNSSLFYITRFLKAPGPAAVVSQENLSFESALYSALLALERGDIDIAIVGGADIFAGPSELHFSRMATATARMNRLGEGSAFVVLASDRVKDVNPHGFLRGLALGSCAGSKEKTTLAGLLSNSTISTPPHETQLALGIDHDIETAESIGKELGYGSVYHYRQQCGDYPTASAFALCGFLGDSNKKSRRFVHANISSHGVIGSFQIART
jgi:3-oxoacyl-[acyl-carrier-protein] synthase II